MRIIQETGDIEDWQISQPLEVFGVGNQGIEGGYGGDRGVSLGILGL